MLQNINPDYAAVITTYVNYWITFLAVPTIGMFFLVLVYQLDLKRQKELKEANKYVNLFKKGSM